MFAACILFALPTIKNEFVNSDRHAVYNSRTRVVAMEFVELSQVRQEIAKKYAEEEKIAEQMMEDDLAIQLGGQGALPLWLLQAGRENLDSHLIVVQYEIKLLEDRLREIEISLLPIH